MHIAGIKILNDADIEEGIRKMFNEAADSLKLDDKTQEKYEEYVEENVQFIKKGSMPRGIVAGTIYIVCLLTGQHRGQKEIAEACGTTETSVRKYYKLMKGGFYDVHQPKLNG